MTYLYWFLLFLSVPILVHLFNFRRAKRLLFTNVRFIQQVSSETKSKTRLKHLLILGSRLLAFLFFVLAFLLGVSLLSPSEDAAVGGEQDIAYYFDNSISATGDDFFGTVDLLRQLAEQNDASRATLLTNDFDPFSNRPRLKSVLLDEIENLKISYAERNLSSVLDRLEGAHDRVYLLTDFNSSTAEDFERIKQDSTRTYRIVISDQQNMTNAFVDTLFLLRDINDYNYSNLTCQLALTSTSFSSNVVVKLLDAEGRQFSSAVANVDNGYRVVFSVPRTVGQAQYTIRLSGDNLTYDNEFFLLIEGNQIPSVTILSSDRNQYLEEVFNNRELFDLTLARPDEIDYESLRTKDFIVLNNFDQLPAGLIGSTVSSTFLVIPGFDTDVKNYQELLDMQILSNEDDTRSEIILEADYYLSGIFENGQREIALPTAISKFDATTNSFEILALRNGRDYLSKHLEKPIYFLSSPLTDDFTSLPTHSIFLPLMYRIAELSVDADQSLFVYPNEYLEIPQNFSDRPPKIVSEEVEIVPEFSNQNNSGMLKIPGSLAPGFYSVMLEQDTIASFGLNLPKSESLGSRLSATEITAFFNDADHVSISTESEDVDVLYAETSKSSLWKYALLLALFFLALETAFHKFLK